MRIGKKGIAKKKGGRDAPRAMSRRRFLGMAGAAGAALLLGGYEGPVASRAAHIRLLVSGEEFDDRIGRLVRFDPVVRAWYAEVRRRADELLGTGPTDWRCGSIQGDCLNYREAATGVEDRIYTLALAYLVDGYEEHAERAWGEMEAAAGLPDWNPDEFLDVAHVTSGMAVGYNWLGPVLGEDRRAVAREAIREKGLEPALEAHQRGEWWTGRRISNWTFACNGAAAIGALAVRGSFPDLAGEVLDAARSSVRTALEALGRDGGWREGPEYWSYGVGFAVRYLASLESALGDDGGLSETPGLDETGAFRIHTTGPDGLLFDFADSNAEQDPERGGTPEMFWLSRRYDRPVYTWAERTYGAGGVRAILYYRPNLDGQDPADAGLPLEARFRATGIATMRSSWEEGAVFTGLKAGSNKASHGHLDLGSFVLDAGGRRWAEDLGLDNYALPGYGGSRRWAYYRTRAEGHNTLVINPGAGPDQDPAAEARFTRFASGDDGAVAVVDLTGAYAAHASEVRRGFKLFDGRRRLVVQDEISAAEPAEVWWFMHTRASIDDPGGGREALLTGEDGSRLWARILSPSGAGFAVMPAGPLPTSPNPYPEQQRDRSAFGKLAVHLTDVTTERLAVLLVPLGPDDEPPEVLPEVTPLDGWRA